MSLMGDRAAKDALFEGFAEVAKALSSGRRAEIVDLLAQGERPVEQIAAEIQQSVANTSHHLRALARGGLLTTRREGTRIYYGLSSDRVAELWAAIRTSPRPTSTGSSDSPPRTSAIAMAWRSSVARSSPVG